MTMRTPNRITSRFHTTIAHALLLLAIVFSTALLHPTFAQGSQPSLRTVASGVSPSVMAYRVMADGEDVVLWTTPNGIAVRVGTRPETLIQDPEVRPPNPWNPKLEVTRDGRIYVLYSTPRGYKLVSSQDRGQRWSAARTVTSVPYEEIALAAAPQGRVSVVWIDDRAAEPALYAIASTDGGETWSSRSRISVREVCSCCTPSVAFGADGTLYVAFRDVTEGSLRDIVVARSADGGKKWTTPTLVHRDGWKLNACPAAPPVLQIDQKGRVHVVWWTGHIERAGIYHAVSADKSADKFPSVTRVIPTNVHPMSLGMTLVSGSSGSASDAVAIAWKIAPGVRTPWRVAVAPNARRPFKIVSSLAPGVDSVRSVAVESVRKGIRAAVVVPATSSKSSYDIRVISAPMTEIEKK
jgi:hypothetical protein